MGLTNYWSALVFITSCSWVGTDFLRIGAVLSDTSIIGLASIGYLLCGLCHRVLISLLLKNGFCADHHAIANLVSSGVVGVRLVRVGHMVADLCIVCRLCLGYWLHLLIYHLLIPRILVRYLVVLSFAHLILTADQLQVLRLLTLLLAEAGWHTARFTHVHVPGVLDLLLQLFWAGRARSHIHLSAVLFEFLKGSFS